MKYTHCIFCGAMLKLNEQVFGFCSPIHEIRWMADKRPVVHMRTNVRQVTILMEDLPILLVKQEYPGSNLIFDAYLSPDNPNDIFNLIKTNYPDEFEDCAITWEVIPPQTYAGSFKEFLGKVT